MYDVIAAVSKNRVIGKDGKLPWNIKEDLRHFRDLTNGHVVIMGKNTYLSILMHLGHPLTNRQSIVITSTPDIFQFHEDVIFVEMSDFGDHLIPEGKRAFVIGGSEIYSHFLPNASTMHITHIDKVYTGDKYFPPFCMWKLVEHSEKYYDSTEKCNFSFLTYKRCLDENIVLNDLRYLKLLHTVTNKGSERPDRTGTGTKGMFGKHLTFDISEHVPLLTTKFVPWKSCIKELLWFMKGQTDATILQEQDVHIWDGNTTREFLDSRGLTSLPEGDIGCGYGFQWRHFGEQYKTCKDTYTGGFDQLSYVIDQLKNDPYSRRIFMSAWNPQHMHNMALPPCHVSAQFYVDQDRNLSCHMYQRSVDCFLGLPFNIFSYTVLTHILATICDMKPKELIISMGDTHVYLDHMEQVNKQLDRIPIAPPKLYVNPRIKDIPIEDIHINDFDVIGYFHHDTLKGKMSV
jgi:thymidylate synthase